MPLQWSGGQALVSWAKVHKRADAAEIRAQQ